MQTQIALFLGLALLGGGQPEQDSSPSDKLAAVSEQAEATPAEEASCCHSCGDSCEHDSIYRWMLYEMCLGPLFHGDCNMVPHWAYYPEVHGYYYFRPYHYSHIRLHQEFVSSFGEDPRAPYANTVFQQVYRQLESGKANSYHLPGHSPAAKPQPQTSPKRTTVRPVSLQRSVPVKKKRKAILSHRK